MAVAGFLSLGDHTQGALYTFGSFSTNFDISFKLTVLHTKQKDLPTLVRL